jgi:hypothetical protein
MVVFVVHGGDEDLGAVDRNSSVLRSQDEPAGVGVNVTRREKIGEIARLPGEAPGGQRAADREQGGGAAGSERPGHRNRLRDGN